MTLKEKLDLWVKITGLNPQEEKRNYTIYFNGRISDYDIKKYNDAIMEALSYDADGRFTECYLAEYFRRLIKGRSFSLEALLEEPELYDYISDVRLLHGKLLKSGAESSVLADGRKAIEFYHLPSDKLSVFDMIELRTSAARCMDGTTLRLLQFSAGPAAGGEFRVYHDVYLYENLNELLSLAAAGHMDGVSLAYIRCPQYIEESYFAFVIKNGGNLYLLTDKPEHVHPQQVHNRRAPGRDMERRISRACFPYASLSGIDISDMWDSGRYGLSETSTALSLNTGSGETRKWIGSLQTLYQDEAFWIINMFSLIRDRFHNSEPPQTVLSYSGAMVDLPFLDRKYTLPALPAPFRRITLEPVDSLDSTDSTGFARSSGRNTPLVEYYKDRIDKSVLNLVEGMDSFYLLPEKDDFGRETGPKYLALSLNDCYTEKELLFNQRWIARYNAAKQINDMIQKDFETSYNSVKGAMTAMVEKRLEALVCGYLKNMAAGEKDVAVERNSYDRWYADTGWGYDTVFCGEKGAYFSKKDIRSYFSSNTPGIVLTFRADSPEEFRRLADVDAEALPPQLEFWYMKGYTGNTLLDNVDPYDWVIKNPWRQGAREMKFAWHLVLSKQEYLSFCREAGVPEDRFWLKEKPACHRNRRDGDICNGARRNLVVEGVHQWNVLNKKCGACPYYKDNIKQKGEHV